MTIRNRNKTPKTFDNDDDYDNDHKIIITTTNYHFAKIKENFFLKPLFLLQNIFLRFPFSPFPFIPLSHLPRIIIIVFFLIFIVFRSKKKNFTNEKVQKKVFSFSSSPAFSRVYDNTVFFFYYRCVGTPFFLFSFTL